MPGSSAAKTPHYQLESVPVPNQPMSTQGPERRSSPATQAASQGKVPNQNPFEDEKDKDSSSVLLGRVVENHFPPLYYRYMSNEKISPEDEINGIESNEEMQCIAFLNSINDDDRRVWLLKKALPKGFALIDRAGAVVLAEEDEKQAALDTATSWRVNGKITRRLVSTALEVVPKLPSKMKEAELDIFYKDITLFLAPYVDEYKEEERKKAFDKVLKILSKLKPSHLDEIYNFVKLGDISAKNLDEKLSIKARSAVIDIYYLNLKKWEGAQKESTIEFIAKKWVSWLNENFSDRSYLGIMQGDIQRLDLPAFQKLMVLKRSESTEVKKILSDIGLPAKIKVYDPEAAQANTPSATEVRDAFKKGRSDAPFLARKLHRLQYRAKNIG